MTPSVQTQKSTYYVRTSVVKPHKQLTRSIIMEKVLVYRSFVHRKGALQLRIEKIIKV